MVRSFGESIYTGKININQAEIDQSNLLENMVKCNNKSRPITTEGKDKKRDTYESAYALYEGRELTLNAFKSGMIPMNEIKGKGLKILSPKKCFKDYQ